MINSIINDQLIWISCRFREKCLHFTIISINLSVEVLIFFIFSSSDRRCASPTIKHHQFTQGLFFSQGLCSCIFFFLLALLNLWLLPSKWVIYSFQHVKKLWCSVFWTSKSLFVPQCPFCYNFIYSLLLQENFFKELTVYSSCLYSLSFIIIWIIPTWISPQPGFHLSCF